MLEAIRKRAGSFVVKILFLFLVLSFGVWGIADVFRPGGGADWAAEVGDVEISSSAFQEEYRQTLRRLSQAMGGNMDAEQARALGLPSSVLNHMIEGALFDQAAADLGVTTTDAMAREQIKADPRFRNQAGVFDPEVFRETLRRNGFTEDRYVGLLRLEMRREQLLSSIAGGAVAPRSLVEATEQYRGERRIAEHVLIPTAMMTQFPDPDEPTLRQFYQDQPGLFTAPEYRGVSVVVLSPDEASKGISIDDADLQAAYHERNAEFTVPERRSFQQIVFAAEAAARSAHERLAQGAEFAAVAADLDRTLQEVAPIGPVQREQLPPDLASAVFTLPPGQASAPIRTSLGWHIIQVTAIEPGHAPTLAEVKERLEAKLKREKAVDSLIDLGNKLDDALGLGARLQEAAAELELPLRTIPAVDATGLDPTGAAVPNLPPGLLDTAFATAQGAESSLIDAGDDIYFVLRVDAVTPSALRPFESIRTQVAEAWRAEQKDQQAKRLANELVNALRNGRELTPLAKEKQLKAVTTPPFTRNGEAVAPDLSRAAVAALFDAKPGETVTVPVQGGFVVARLTSVLPPAPDTDATGQAALRSELTEAMRGDIVAQFAAGLRGRYPVKINPRALESL
jgi:peptidyl-prolyl cis-trans isomerase D